MDLRTLCGIVLISADEHLFVGEHQACLPSLALIFVVSKRKSSAIIW